MFSLFFHKTTKNTKIFALFSFASLTMESLLAQMKAVITNAESEPAAPIRCPCPSTSKPSLKRKRVETGPIEAGAKDWEAEYKKSEERFDVWKAAAECALETLKTREEALHNTIRERDDELKSIREDTNCAICLDDKCFVGKICGSNCNIKCCFGCFVDLGRNRQATCPGCRGPISGLARTDCCKIQRILRTPAHLALQSTPRNVVQDELFDIMSGQLPELRPSQISRRLDDLFAHTEAPIPTVTEMFEAALPPAPETPTANVSGSHTTVVNGTTYYFDD